MVRRQIGQRLRQHDRQVETDAGLWVMARSARWGRFTFPPTRAAFARGLRELGPHLLGEDPTELGRLNRRMDAASRGIPMSNRASTWPAGTFWARRRASRCACCWAAAMATILGSTAPSRRSRPRRWPRRVAGYRAEGYRRFQLKVGGDPDVDIARIRAVAAMLEPGDRLIADANTGWLMHDALRVVRGRARCRCLHRAALPELRGMSLRPPAYRSSVRPGRDIDGIEVLLRGQADRRWTWST